MKRLTRPVTVRVPNDLEYINALLALAREIASGCGFQERDIRKIEMALEEASANVILHAFTA